MIEAVEDVIQALTDSSSACIAAAEKADRDDLERILRGIAERRQWFAADLQVMGGGDEPPPQRSMSQALRELWMDLRDRLSERNQGLLAELERSEGVLVSRYRRALSGDEIPDQLLGPLKDQLAEIEGTRDRLRVLRERESLRR